MRNVTRRFAVIAALAAGMVHVGPGDAAAPARTTYMIALRDASLVAEAQQRAHAQRAGTNALAGQKRAMREALKASASATYLRGLDTARNKVLDLGSRLVGRRLSPAQIYRYATNGMALDLTEAEAAQIAQLPGVAAIRKERIEHLHTDAGPQWIGADALWNGQVGGIAASKGEGVVIGVIDTGINSGHPSFAANGPDGYAIANPRGHFLGLCATGQAACNNKLIGIYDYTDEGSLGFDTVGHGSHVSGIAAGDAITATLHGMTANVTRPVSGVAPHANLIMYKACDSQTIAGESGTCKESWLIQAIDQAIADDVDVINYSIGGGTVDPYVLLADKTSDVYAFYSARAAGIVIAVSAGNDGPTPGTLDEPGNAPWVIGVANASHNRRFVNALSGLSGAPDAPADLFGQSLSGGVGPATIVYAGDYGNALCGTGTSEGVTPNGASNPFPAGTFHGEIVVCDRGIYARVEKGYNVLAAGAGGMVLANAQSDGESVVADDHFLPAVHLGYSEGQALKQWLTASGTHSGIITAAGASLANAFGDILDSSSSRGPYGFSGGILKPDITAPGQNILSAAPNGSGLAILTGTSMASPHVAGSAALVLGVHSDWDPSQVESALLGTALANSVRLQDGASLASPLDAGTGRVRPALAANAGLYLQVAAADFLAAAGSFSVQTPINHGDLRTVNRLGMQDEHCFQSCTFTRTVTDMSAGGTWQATTSAAGGTQISVTPATFTLAAGASQALTITVDVSDPHLPGTWTNGSILLHKVSGGSAASDTALTAAVYADPGTPPAFQEISANAPSGSAFVNLTGLPALPIAEFAATTLDAGQATQLTMTADATPGDPYGLPKTGEKFILVPYFESARFATCPGGMTQCYSQTGIVVIEVGAFDAPAINLYAGIDTDGDGQPEAGEQLCAASVSSGDPLVARCVIDLSKVQGNVWALVQVPQGVNGVQYHVSVNAAAPLIGKLGSGGVVSATSGVVATGPGHVPPLQTFPLRVSWPGLGVAGLSNGRYFGAVFIDGAPNLQGLSGMLPFALTVDDAGVDAADALLPIGIRNVTLTGMQPAMHRFIDVPPGAALLEIDSALTTGALGTASFGFVRDDFPAFSASPQIAAAPSQGAAVSWTLSSTQTTNSATIPVTPGRWYLTSQYDNSNPTSVQISTQLNYTGAAATGIAPGAYYNPQRSGQGIFVSQASGQQALDWYTYLEDGTPTWYTAQATLPDPAGAAWVAPLQRVNWDGNEVNSRITVGQVVLTPVSASDLIFSWNLDGVTGSERFTRLGAGTCPNFNGATTNFNGAWYAPGDPGYGMDVVALPDLQFAAFYFYDALGIARWGSGSASPFAASSSIALTQNQGFCPVCAYVAVTTQPLGALTVNYASAGNGTYASDLALKTPLSGAWNVDQPIVRLTGTSSCP